MNTILKSIPNILTLANLTFGVIGIIVWQHNIILSATCIFIAMIFDFFDGFVARILKASSEIGKQLDSLADMVSFGVLPCLVIFGLLHPDFLWININEIPASRLLLLLTPIFSALRLAKFNIDESQSYGFKGLPTPANAFWIASLPFILYHYPEDSLTYLFLSQHINMTMLAVIGATLLIIPIPLMSLKFKSINLKENFPKYLLLLISVILFVLLKWLSLPLIIVSYIIISLIFWFFNRLKE
jgi:CDP-diacylglycerol--serine O-phosphatidyltransferase